MAIKFGIMPAMVEGFDEDTGLPLYDDRAVDETYFARFHAEILTDGISAKDLGAFQVTATDTMALSVQPGAAFIQGYFAYDEEENALDLETAAASMSRIDRVILRLNKPDRRIHLEIRQGEPGQSQLLPPELERNDDIWELCLAEVRVSAGAAAVTQADITDTRLDTDLCGVTENPLGGVSDDLFKQYDQVFQDWHSRLKDILDENAAANLQTQIDTVKEDMASVATRLDALEKTTYTQTVTTAVADVNDYMQQGKYYFSTSYTPVNIPDGVNGWLTVETTAGSDWVVQYWRRAGSWNVTPTYSQTFTRSYNGSEWSPWSIVMTSQVSSASTANFNNFNIPGIHYFHSSTTLTNCPDGTNGTLIVLGGTSSSSHTKQIWLRTGTPGSNDSKLHHRTYTDTVGWGKWYTLAP